MQYKYRLIITFLYITLGCLQAHAYVNKEFSVQRGLFLQVEADLKKGTTLSYNKHKQALMNYPLYPYLYYEILKSSIHTTKHSELSAFITTYHDSPLSNKLRNEWLRSKASKQLWVDYLKAYEPKINNDVELQCHYINATLKTTNDKSVYKLLPNIWLQGKELPKACDPVFHAWKKDGGLTKNLLWKRIKLAIVQNEHKLARNLAKNLPLEDIKIVELWIRTHNDPHLIVKQHYFTERHSAISEMMN
jgi:soluble lytic murein transglycosylase